MPAADAEPPADRWGALRYPGFLLFWTSRLCASFSAQIVSVAVGWQIYDLTRNPFDLGLVGLIQFTPALLLVLVTGTVSDRFNRRGIFAVCEVVEAACGLTLLVLTVTGAITPGRIFAILAVFGVARAFMNPAAQSLLPNLVPERELSSAIALSSSSWQIATIVGPVVGGLLYGVAAAAPYASAFVLFLAAGLAAILVPRPPQKTMAEPATWATVIAGFRYVWHEKIVLGAISLDLFAVLLGGAVALLPAYARDMLVTGPWGLGLLRSAPGIGALLTALYLAVRPVGDHAGRSCSSPSACSAPSRSIFGVSTAVWLSVLALALAGAADMVSVYIRETLIQLWTPDAVRGRVNAVNMVFVGASNELGEFRAGTVAALIGVVPAVVVGGIGTLAVAGIWAWAFPMLRQTRRLDRRAIAGTGDRNRGTPISCLVRDRTRRLSSTSTVGTQSARGADRRFHVGESTGFRRGIAGRPDVALPPLQTRATGSPPAGPTCPCAPMPRRSAAGRHVAGGTSLRADRQLHARSRSLRR